MRTSRRGSSVQQIRHLYLRSMRLYWRVRIRPHLRMDSSLPPSRCTFCKRNVVHRVCEKWTEQFDQSSRSLWHCDVASLCGVSFLIPHTMMCLVPHTIDAENESTWRKKREDCVDKSPNDFNPDKDMNFKVEWYRQYDKLVSSSLRYFLSVKCLITNARWSGLVPK